MMNRRFLLRFLGLAGVAAIAAPGIAQEEQPYLYSGEKLKDVTLPQGAPMTLEGWTRQGRGEVYRLGVKAGQTIRIEYTTSSRYCMLVVFDLETPDEDALFASDENGLSGVLTAETDTQWLIRPTHIRGSSRRGLGAHYTIRLLRQ